MTINTAPAAGTSTPARRMNVGVAGLGAGAVQVTRAMANTPYIQLTAAADVRPEALAAFKSRFQGRTYASVEALCRDPEVEVVWVSTPNQFHCEHTITAATHGKHVVVDTAWSSVYPRLLNL
jgi:phthalate 4,5-cis-dihydrodiol dehydrogenase